MRSFICCAPTMRTSSPPSPPSTRRALMVHLFGDSAPMLTRSSGPNRVIGGVMANLKQSGRGAVLNFVDRTVGDATLSGILDQLSDFRHRNSAVREDGPSLVASGRGFRLPHDTLAVLFWLGNDLKEKKGTIAHKGDCDERFKQAERMARSSSSASSSRAATPICTRCRTISTSTSRTRAPPSTASASLPWTPAA